MLAMAKRHDKPTLSVIREPSGRRSRSSHPEPKDFPPTLVKRLREAAIAHMQDARWGSELGRLYLTEKIDESMMVAGERWASTVKRYHEVMGGSRPPRSAALERQSPAEPPDPDSDVGLKIVRREQNVIDAMRDAHKKLTDAGKLAENAVRAVCEHDEPAISEVELDALTIGLRALADHWHLTKSGRRANGISSR